MKLFTQTNWQLTILSENWFSLEKEMQKLTENNLNTIFWLEFIATELTLHNFRIDTLAYDQENKSFIIIEYKKWSSWSVIDQWYAYLSLMLNNKADFVQQLSVKHNKVLSNKDINREASKVIFIANGFTNYQTESINFKDLPIALWEMKQYWNNIIYNPIQAKNTLESIKTIEKWNNAINVVTREIVTYDESSHLKWKPENIVNLYYQIKDFLLSLYDFDIVYNQNYLVFKRNNKNFVSIDISKNSIKSWIYCPYWSLEDKYWLIRDVTNVWNYWGAHNEVKLISDDNLLKYFDLIKQAFTYIG